VKRKFDDGGHDEEEPNKIARYDRNEDMESENDERYHGQIDSRQEEILEYVESKDGGEYPQEEVYDATFLKKLLLRFEKAITANAEQRTKFAAEPMKFLDSEEELDASIKALSMLTQTNLYGDIIKSGSLESLAALLAHENSDIIHSAIKILGELTDVDAVADQASIEELANALLHKKVIQAIGGFLTSLEEEEEGNRLESDHVFDTLDLIENLCGIEGVAEQIFSEPTILHWLFRRISNQDKPLAWSKKHSAELLFQLVLEVPNVIDKTVSDDNNGIDILLQEAAIFRYTDPDKNSEEEEFAENVFNILCILARDPRLKTSFLEAEGVELMIILVRDSKWARSRALNVLDDSLKGYTSGPVAGRIVEAAGLKPLFGVLNKNDEKVLARIVSIAASMLRWLEIDSPDRIRTVGKLTENNNQRVKKLVAFRETVSTRIRKVKIEIDEEKRVLREQDVDNDEMLEAETEWEVRLADSGIEMLQSIDVIFAWLLVEDSSLEPVISNLLIETGQSLDEIKTTLRGMFGGIFIV
jgi:beta-catenin-like protein 1